jgi:hypothetical protein
MEGVQGANGGRIEDAGRAMVESVRQPGQSISDAGQKRPGGFGVFLEYANRAIDGAKFFVGWVDQNSQAFTRMFAPITNALRPAYEAVNGWRINGIYRRQGAIPGRRVQ